VTYFLGSCSRLSEGRFDLYKEVCQIIAGKPPLKRLSYSLVMVLKAKQSVFKGGQRIEIVRSKYFSLNDRKVDFDLIQPAGMNRRMNQNDSGPTVSQTLGSFESSMRRTVINDPEHTGCGAVRLLIHDLIHESVEGIISIGRFASSEDFGAMDIPSRQVCPGAETLVVMLHTHGSTRLRRQSGMLRLTRLDTGFFISRDNKLVGTQGRCGSRTGIQIQYGPSFFGETRIARKQPTAVTPRLNRVLTQPTPQSSFTDASDDSLIDHLSANVGKGQPRQRKVAFTRKLASQCFNLNGDAGGKKGRPAAPRLFVQP